MGADGVDIGAANMNVLMAADAARAHRMFFSASRAGTSRDDDDVEEHDGTKARLM